MNSIVVRNEVFVGGLPQDCPEEMIQDYFSGWGVVQKIEYKFGRGFAFVTFEDEYSVDSLLENHAKHAVNGKWVDCKRAENRRGQSTGGYGGGKGDKGDGMKGGGKGKGGGFSKGGDKGGKGKGKGSGDKGGYHNDKGGKSSGKGFQKGGKGKGGKDQGYGGYQQKGRPSPYGGGYGGY